jgi:hypothetical protein
MSNENETKHIPVSNEPIGSKKEEDDEDQYKGTPYAALLGTYRAHRTQVPRLRFSTPLEKAWGSF